MRGNALNLSALRSGKLVREMEMGLGLSGWSRIGAGWLYAAAGVVDQRKDRGEGVQAAPHAQKARAKDGLECAQRVDPVRTTGLSLIVRRIEIAE